MKKSPVKKKNKPFKKGVKNQVPKKSGRKEPSKDSDVGDVQRLQRAMAAAGFGSRRECEEFIETGRVQVDGKTVTKLGTKVDPYSQKIFVDGQRLTMERRQYFVLNKPPGIVSTSKDPSGRLRVIDLIRTEKRVYNVGRLDQSSEGLILVTNDGDLANRLTHPRYGVAKKYLVQVHGVPEGDKLKSLIKGVYLAEGKARVANIKFKKRAKDTAWLEIVLEEGRNREIRRLLASVGHKVLRLRRIEIGPLKLGDLPVGAHRALSAQEVRELKKSIASKPVKRKRFRKTTTSESRESTGKKKTAKRKTPKLPKRASKKTRSMNPTGRGQARAASSTTGRPKKSKKKSVARKKPMKSLKTRTKKRGR